MKLKDLVQLKPFIEAIEQGKTIQCKHDDGSWADVRLNEPSAFSIAIGFNDIMENFRIKPEPRVFYVREELARIGIMPELYGAPFNGLQFVKLIEVIE